MKKFSGIVLGMFISCVIYTQTQSEINEASGSRLKKSENHMIEVMKKISILYKDENNFLRKLRISQNLWLKFRKAQLDALFPAIDKQIAYGSSFPMAYANAKAELNKQRIEQLMVWVNGIEEGNVGSGSVRFKSQLTK